jgi:hypothetical protein
MYDNGLQDPELQMYHKEIKFSINLFLQDILTGTFSEYFKTETLGGYVHIYPLFYTDKISIDDDKGIVFSPYKIVVPVGYTGLITFTGEDEQIVESKRKYVNESDGYVTVMIYNAKTREFLPYQNYMVEYPNYPVVRLSTGKNGYGGFIKLEDDYNVVIL